MKKQEICKMKRKIKLVKEFGFLWRTEIGVTTVGKYRISTKIRKLRHENDIENSMVVQN